MFETIFSMQRSFLTKIDILRYVKINIIRFKINHKSLKKKKLSSIFIYLKLLILPAMPAPSFNNS